MEIKYNVQVPPKKSFNGGAKSEEVKAIEDFLTSGNVKNMKQFRDGDKKVEIKGSTYTWTVSRSETSTIDKKALEADGLLEKYQKKSEQYRMTVK